MQVLCLFWMHSYLAASQVRAFGVFVRVHDDEGVARFRAPGPGTYKYDIYKDGRLKTPPKFSFGSGPRFPAPR